MTVNQNLARGLSKRAWGAAAAERRFVADRGLQLSWPQPPI
jgi:hypothetical protein